MLKSTRVSAGNVMGTTSSKANNLSKLIYIIEDDQSIREMLDLALKSFAYEVQAFDNAESALEAIKQRKPDMAIFDIMLPGISGLEAIKQLRQSSKTANLLIVLLTVKGSEMDKVTGLDCGADDYITKPFSVMELGARLRMLFRRSSGVEARDTEPKSVQIADLLVNRDTREVTKSGRAITLTFREFELLWALIIERERIIPRDELFLLVWGNGYMGESRTLDMHIRTLRDKLGDDADEPRYIKTVRNVGYRFIGLDE